MAADSIILSSPCRFEGAAEVLSAMYGQNNGIVLVQTNLFCLKANGDIVSSLMTCFTPRTCMEKPVGWDLLISCHFLDEDHSNVSLLAVATHEIGHALGLRHSCDPESLMFAWYSHNVTSSYIISSMDSQELAKLYGESSPGVNSPVERIAIC